MDEKKVEKSDVEKLLPKEKEVVVAGETFVVKPYKVKDLVFFSREIQEAVGAIRQKNPNLQFKESEALKFIPLLMGEGERLIGLMARSIGKDRTWLAENGDIAGFSSLFLAITEVNDFGVIISNFMLGWGLLKTQKVGASATA